MHLIFQNAPGTPDGQSKPLPTWKQKQLEREAAAAKQKAASPSSRPSYMPDPTATMEVFTAKTPAGNPAGNPVKSPKQENQQPMLEPEVAAAVNQEDDPVAPPVKHDEATLAIESDSKGDEVKDCSASPLSLKQSTSDDQSIEQKTRAEVTADEAKNDTSEAEAIADPIAEVPEQEKTISNEVGFPMR